VKRITVTLPDELERDLCRYLARQETPPSLTAVAQVALREFLRNRQLRDRGVRTASKPFALAVLPEKDELGEGDVSLHHDQYLGSPRDR